MFIALRFLQRSRLARAAAWLGAGLATLQAVAALNELDVKAAVLANLLAFADWPATAAPPPNAALVLCVGPQQPLRAPLATLNGRVVRNWVLQVRELKGSEATTHCHALLLDDELLAARPALRRELASLPVLSFADAQQAADIAVCIRLDVIHGRVGFTVDLATARANGLTLSSRLLRLAREVKE
jgi:hypothetical protein